MIANQRRNGRDGGKRRTSLTLEGNRERLAIDQHVTGDDPHGHTLGKDVQKGGLAGSGLAHNYGEQGSVPIQVTRRRELTTYGQSSCRGRRIR